jgi:hypothetical protein
MAPSWDEIYELEVNLMYPAAIEALEERLKGDPDEKEAVIRLGFHYWFVISENDCLSLNVPVEQYAARFRELLWTYEDILGEDADFCFSYGLGLSLSFYDLVARMDDLEAYEALGKKLMKKAASLDAFYKRLNKGKVTQEQIARHFRGRGCFARYYGVA